MNIEQLYQQRLRRYVTALRNEKPDQVPIRPFVAETVAKHAGYTCQEVTHDYEKAFDAVIKMGRDFRLQSYNNYREHFQLSRLGDFSDLTRDVVLPTSSSVVHSITIRQSARRWCSITARVASDARPIPAFMSNTPGP